MNSNINKIYEEFNNKFEFYINENKVSFEAFMKYHKYAYKMHRPVPKDTDEFGTYWVYERQMYEHLDTVINKSGEWTIPLGFCVDKDAKVNPFKEFNADILVFKVKNLTDSPSEKVSKEILGIHDTAVSEEPAISSYRYRPAYDDILDDLLALADKMSYVDPPEEKRDKWEMLTKLLSFSLDLLNS